MLETRLSERSSRIIDHDGDASIYKDYEPTQEEQIDDTKHGE